MLECWRTKLSLSYFGWTSRCCFDLGTSGDSSQQQTKRYLTEKRTESWIPYGWNPIPPPVACAPLHVAGYPPHACDIPPPSDFSRPLSPSSVFLPLLSVSFPPLLFSPPLSTLPLLLYDSTPPRVASPLPPST